MLSSLICYISINPNTDCNSRLSLNLLFHQQYFVSYHGNQSATEAEIEKNIYDRKGAHSPPYISIRKSDFLFQNYFPVRGPKLSIAQRNPIQEVDLSSS